MKITAVVVTFNRLELLKKSIASLQANRHIDDIIVVNNGSTDGTGEWLAGQNGLSILTQENVGGSGGFYSGIRKAYDEGADWIWCMDDDVFPRPDCLDELLRHTQLTDVGIMAPRRLMNGKVFAHEFRHYNFSNPLASLHGGKLRFDKPADAELAAKGEPVEIVGCDFEGPFISRKVVERIGLPNRELFIFYDDTDYCLRAHKAGFRLFYVPLALMDKHLFFAEDTWTSRNQKKKWKRYYQIRNGAYLNHHYGNNLLVRHLRSFIGMLGYLVTAFVTMPFTRAWQPKDIGMLWRAYRDGVCERLGKR